MKTLKEISASNPSTYKVTDSAVNRGDLKSWSDRIEIIYHENNEYKSKNKEVTRKGAFKFGLCEGV